MLSHPWSEYTRIRHSMLCILCVHVEWSMKKGEKPGKKESEQQTVCVSLASFKHTLSVYCGTNFLSIWKFIFVKLSILNKIMLFYLCMSVCLLHSILHSKCSAPKHVLCSRNELEFRHNMHIRHTKHSSKQRWKILKIAWANNKQQEEKKLEREILSRDSVDLL